MSSATWCFSGYCACDYFFFFLSYRRIIPPTVPSVFPNVYLVYTTLHRPLGIFGKLHYRFSSRIPRYRRRLVAVFFSFKRQQYFSVAIQNRPRYYWITFDSSMTVVANFDSLSRTSCVVPHSHCAYLRTSGATKRRRRSWLKCFLILRTSRFPNIKCNATVLHSRFSIRNHVLLKQHYLSTVPSIPFKSDIDGGGGT